MTCRFSHCVPVVFFAQACAHGPLAQTERMDALATRVIQLELQVSELEAKLDSSESDQATREQRAQELYRDLRAALEAGRTDDAKLMLKRLETEFMGTGAWRSAQRVSVELLLLGKVAPAVPNQHVDFWFNPGSLDFHSGTTLVVYWEAWCPHCVREVPELEDLSTRLGPEGLKVVALTRLTKSSTEERVRDFILEHELTIPMGKENGQLAEWAEVTGIPAAVVVRDGEAVWRGHPGTLTDAMLRGLLVEP